MTFTTEVLEAKQIKKEMKSLGIKVFRCAQNKRGCLITIDSSYNNQVKAIEFFNAKNMRLSETLIPKPRNTSCRYIDYGTMFKWVEL